MEKPQIQRAKLLALMIIVIETFLMVVPPLLMKLGIAIYAQA
jgi:hypothetical protein